jgi:hypothetical protein
MLLDAATMDDATCNVIYVSRDVREDRNVRAHALAHTDHATNGKSSDVEFGDVAQNIRLLVETFTEGRWPTRQQCCF